MAQARGLQARLGVLFAEVATARADRLGMLGDVQCEPVWRRLAALRYDVRWVEAEAAEGQGRAGWTPVVDRRRLGETVIYLDRAGKRVLMCRPPGATGGG